MPRNDAADRYSPDTAAALKAGEMRREATRKSDVVRIAATPRAPMRSVASTTGTTASAITGGPVLRLGPLGAAQLPPGQRGEHRPRQHGDRQPGDRHVEQPHVVERGNELQQQRQAHQEGPAGEQGRHRPAQLHRADPLGPRQLVGCQPRSAGGRTAPAAERHAGLRAGHRDPARLLPPARPVTAPTAPVHRPSRRAPESNSPRVAASSSRSRSSRACRRLTGTSPTSVCASSPPLTSLRSSCTACTASR